MIHDNESFLAQVHAAVTRRNRRERVEFLLRPERVGLIMEVRQARERRDKSVGSAEDTTQIVRNASGDRVKAVVGAVQRMVTIPFPRRVG